MSSRAKASAMTGSGSLALVPKLRFLEFLEAEGWIAKKLNDICDVNPANSELPDSFVYIDLESVAAGELKSRKIINRDEAPSRAQRLLHSGDVIFQIVRPYQRNNLHFKADENIEYVASTGYAQLRAKHSSDFLFQAIHTDDFVDHVVAKCTGSSYPAINSSDLAEISISIPEPTEQQKVADCLSSADELIAAQARKVDALKTHKKGLMQQLFPRAGETQPRMRFPEFKDAGEWVTKKLGEIAEVMVSGDLDTELYSSIRSEKFIHPVYANGVESEGLYGYYAISRYQRNCITITARGTLGIAFLRHQDFMGIGRLIVASPAQDVNSHFLKECWSHLAKISHEVTSIPQLTAVTARATALPFPPIQEQKRIADCLTSIDDNITAENNRLEALKTHKKGLMQQLFPAAEEVAA